MDEYIYILGNGFNKDLGLRVDYKDFFKSKYWDAIVLLFRTIPLIAYIQNHLEKDKYNIEQMLKSYLSELKSADDAKTDKIGLDVLEDAFSKFVDECDCPKTNSKAYKLLQKIQSDRNNLSSSVIIYVYSFCYTIFDKFRQQQQMNLFDSIKAARHGCFCGNTLGGVAIDVDYIHGRSSGGKSKAIFGLSCNSFHNASNKILEEYAFLLKEKHEHYMPCKKQYLLDSLKRANYIEFFGFSFSTPDRPYVEAWLKQNVNFSGTRNLILNVYDQKDGEQILTTMQDIAGENWQSFYEHYNITIKTAHCCPIKIK